MVFDHEAASRVMHLFRSPDEPERLENLSYCHICLKKATLTKEHIPPKKAFNNCNRLWDRMIVSDGVQSTRQAQIHGGLWVKTLCESCNNDVCSAYAEEYVKLTRHLVEMPKLFDQSGEARLISIKLNTLMIAKEIATMILAIESIDFARHHPELREFVLHKEILINPPFYIYAFLVLEVEEAGNILRYHARVDTFAPGYGFPGGEISWFPFGFIYANKIGERYCPDRLTDISDWFYKESVNTMLRIHCRTTGVDSMQCMVGHKRIRPQIDRINEQYASLPLTAES